MAKNETKLNVHVPIEWYLAVRAEAAANDMSVSNWLRAAIKSALPDDVARELQQPRKQGRQPRKGE